MQKLFEIIPHHGQWDVSHNHVSLRTCARKRDAIRLALVLGRMQPRLGDDAEVVLKDQNGETRARRQIFARAAS